MCVSFGGIIDAYVRFYRTYKDKHVIIPHFSGQQYTGRHYLYRNAFLAASVFSQPHGEADICCVCIPGQVIAPSHSYNPLVCFRL